MKNREYKNFDRTLRKLLKASHGEIKAKLDAEKKARAKSPKAKRAKS